MAYDLYAIPVPPGVDVEDAGEALLELLSRGHPVQDGDDAARRTRDALADDLAHRVLDLTHATARDAAGKDRPWRELRAPSGLSVALSTQFIRFRVPYSHHGEDARVLFETVFELLGVTVTSTGWRVYDPQDADEVSADEDGRDASLEIYLSVMDQLRPLGAR